MRLDQSPRPGVPQENRSVFVTKRPAYRPSPPVIMINWSTIKSLKHARLHELAAIVGRS